MVGSLVDFDCVFLLGIIAVVEGEWVKISVSNLFNYFSKQIKTFPQKSGTLTTTRGGGVVGHFVVGTTQKYHFFLRRP